MKVLFAHLSANTRSEYNVHKIIAENVDPKQIDCFFIWQSNPANPASNPVAKLANSNRNFYYDFGRNFQLVPKPSHLRRAFMMLRQLPGSVLFLIRKIKEIKPDVIYTSQQKWELKLVGIACFFVPTPRLIHLHYMVGPWLGRSAFKAILKSNHLVAVSEFIRQGAIKVGIQPANINSLLNPVDLVRFNVPKDPAWLRKEFGWPPETQVVVAAGRLDPDKGIMILLEAFAKVQVELPITRLLICGETTTRYGYDRLLKDKAAALGLSSYVTFAGSRKDLPQIFAGANLFCLPTQNDAMPLVFLEAMLSELPVVAFRSGGVPEIVVDGVTGLLSEVEDLNGLATNLLRVLKEPTLAKQMSMAGKSRVLSEFTPERVSAKWAELLNKYLSNSSYRIALASQKPSL